MRRFLYLMMFLCYMELGLSTLKGAELASPLDIDIYEAMTTLMLRTKSLKSVFTGIHSLFSYGNYQSLKGVPLNEMPVNWSSIPSSDTNERCVVLLEEGTIYNVKCDSMLPYICYKKNDNITLTECGTVDPEYTLNKELDICYKLHSDSKSWEDAFKTCSAEGGSLTVIHSEAEFAAVVQLFSKDSVASVDLEYRVFVGAIMWQNTNERVTIHDTKLKKSGFSTWPEEIMSYEDPQCLALQRSGLIKVSCLMGKPFVCEKRPDSLIDVDGSKTIINKIITLY